MGNDTENIGTFTAKNFYIKYVGPRRKAKEKRASIHCESKMEKQDLQPRESWLQNSNSTTS